MSHHPRDYQKRLIEICEKKNSIVFLPTGSGKTFISLKVIEHFSGLLQTKLNEGGKRSVFFVNTVCLAKQITENIKEQLGMKTACWTSDAHNKSWSKVRFQAEFEQHEVIVSTAQLFLDAIKHSFISIAQINVMIFDECHHGRKNHPYHEIMKQFKYLHVSSDYPRVIGLSGMLVGISSDLSPETVTKELEALESTFLSTIVTVHRLDEYKNVLLYSTNPRESFIRYEPVVQDGLMKRLREMVDQFRWDLSLINIPLLSNINPQTLRKSKPKKIKAISLMFEDFKHEMNEMGLYGAYLSLNAIRVQYELLKQQPGQHKDILQIIDLCIQQTENMIEMIDDNLDLKNITLEKMLFNVSPKVRILLAILKSKFTDPQRLKDLQCLIFMKRRFTAKCMYHLLKKYAVLDSGFPIKPDFVVGVNNELPESIDDVLSLNFNKFALNRFKEKETNCICASSVLEEGIDLQICNLCVMYDKPETFRSYVQSKGRARNKNSDYIVLLPISDIQKFLKKRESYSAIDNNIKDILIGRTCDRSLNEENIEHERLEIWEPMITKRHAVLNNISAVSLLNRYLSRFVDVNKIWERRDVENGKSIVLINLPSIITTEQIFSDPFEDIKLAKQNAAFRACEILHKMQKLDEYLMPKLC